MNKNRFFAFSTMLALGLTMFVAQAANVVYSANGTLGPVISGSDPGGANGGSGDVVLTMSQSLVPKSHTATTATYKVPAGAIVATVGTRTVKSNAPATVKITVPASGPNTIYVTGTFSYSGITATISATLQLAAHSFTKAALKHPTLFTPASQTITAATKTTPGSKGSYTFLGGTTVLGLSGTVTATSAAE